MTFAETPDGAKDVLLCAITHSPPGRNETGIKVPAAVAKHLGLDHEQSWIKTDQVNRLTWEKGRIPYGISQARKGEWSFGMIPRGLGQQVFDQVREKARNRTLQTIERDERPKDSAYRQQRAKETRAAEKERPAPGRGKSRDDDRDR